MIVLQTHSKTREIKTQRKKVARSAFEKSVPELADESWRRGERERKKDKKRGEKIRAVALLSS